MRQLGCARTSQLCTLLLFFLGSVSVAKAQISTTSGSGTGFVPTTSFINITLLCQTPQPCVQFLGPNSPCQSQKHTRVWDDATSQDICAGIEFANEGDVLYIPSTGMSTARCIPDWKADGRCDLANNHANLNCEYDGGDCCLASCQSFCANTPDVYARASINCNYWCGERANYMCLDPLSRYSTVTAWCGFGTVQAPSDCYATKLEVAKILQECILSNASHGNDVNSAQQCGNKSQTCTGADLIAKNGCHLTPDKCWQNNCCSTALTSGFIQNFPPKLPTIIELYDVCKNGITDNSEQCFKFMVKCVQENRALKGGCCQCSAGWSGFNCKTPLCWPKCKYGECIAPDVCFCSPGWKGNNCAHPICNPECVPGQGLCAHVNQCECFYGWTGVSCEKPLSVPACVNGEPFGPDLCRCERGWGGRLCDYPLCQTWPGPTADCGHGTCMKPFTCECEPGWKLNRPINASGYDILPFWSPGRDVTIATSGTFVKGDSRIRFPSYFDRFYNDSNAFLCEKLDCSQLFDPRCTNCTVAGCIKCESGFFADMNTGRCERCSNVFPHCQLCGPVHDDQLWNVRCLWCDPLYVLYFEECVSDGPVEFGSPVYHAFKDQVNLTLKLHRSVHMLEPSFARPVEVLVRTRDGTAHSRSLPYGDWLAGFEFKVYRVNFPVNRSNTTDLNDDPDLRFVTEQNLNIRIYNDASFHPGLRYFDVELFLPPEHIVGHQGPLTPFLNSHDYEPELLWLPPANFARTPQYERQDVLSTTRVYIWDREEATAANTTVFGDGIEWWNQTVIGITRHVSIVAKMHDGSLSTTGADQFLLICQPISAGHENSLGIPNWVNRSANNHSLHKGIYTPLIVGAYKVLVEKVFPGVYGQYWWNHFVHHNAPQPPDTSRVDHAFDFHWEDISEAPSFARWKFHVHFKCLRTERWTTAFGHGVGIIATPGSTVRVWFENDGMVERYIPLEAQMPDVSGARMAYLDVCPLPGVKTWPMDAFICTDLLFRVPQVDPFRIYTFQVEFEPPRPILGFQGKKTPVSLYAVMFHQDQSFGWGWYPVNPGCLFAGGINVADSPYDGFYAKYGDASPQHSTVLTMANTAGPLHTLVDTIAQAKVTLRDSQNRTIAGGVHMSGALRAELKKGDGSVDAQVTPLFTWFQSLFYYSLTFTPRKPPAGTEYMGSGRITRYLHVTIGGAQIKFSPMEVTVDLGVSDPNQTTIIAGSYTPAKVSETKEFVLLSRQYSGANQVFGGDDYTVRFVGPVHDPRPTLLEYLGVVKDNHNGTYNVTFEIMRAGEYHMHIMLANVHILDSPFFPIVVYADLSAGFSTASGPGVDPADGIASNPARVFAGIETYFEVTVKDYYNVRYYRGGAQLQLTIGAFDASSGDYIRLTDHNNGKYTYKYRICRAGLTAAHVDMFTYGAFHPIHGSPFRVQVLPLDASGPHSPVSIATPMHSGISGRAVVDLRDHCKNVPRNTQNQSSLNVSILRLGPSISGPNVSTDVMRNNPGLANIFFTLGRRGHHELTVLIDGQHANGSPLAFNVTPAGELPRDGTLWIPGAVGGSWRSTFHVLVVNQAANASSRSDDPVIVEGQTAPFAGRWATYHITSRDLWSDPLEIGNDTFIVSLWREGGPCPPFMRCDVFSVNLSICNQMPMCYYDTRDSICRPRCPVSNLSAGYALMDPDVSVVQGFVSGSTYPLRVYTTISGTYHATVTALRPGGVQAYFWDSPSRARRFQAQVMGAPLNFDWGSMNPAPSVPSSFFVARWIGWLRILIQDNYTFSIESDGDYDVFVNGTKYLSVTVDRTLIARNDANINSFHIMLPAGFTPFQIDYTHTPRQRYLGSYFRLSYSSRVTPFQLVPARALYYEEPLTNQKGHPVKHIVKPFPRAAALSVEGESTTLSENRTVTVGLDFTLRVHSVDKYGNVLKSRDPTAKLWLTAQPQLAAAEWQGYVLAAQRWRVVPLANGSWDVLIRPDAALGIWNLTLHLSNLETGGVAFAKHLQVNVVPNTVDPRLSWVLCMPPPPQPAGTLVTCTVVPRDLELNDLSDTEVEMHVRRPGAPYINTTKRMHVIHEVARTFRFRPELAGRWTIYATVLFDEGRNISLAEITYDIVPGLVSTVSAGSQLQQITGLIANDPIELTLIPRDTYGNQVNSSNEEWFIQFSGGTDNTVIRRATFQHNSSVGTYTARVAPILERTAYLMRVEHVSRRLNTSLGLCPDLQLISGRTVGLSRHRGVGSIATLGCLPGYEWVSGNTTLRCEVRDGHAVAHGTEWHDLYSQPASMLVCRPRVSWCPLLDFVNSELYSWNWRREIGSRASVQCLEGFVYMFGDRELVCGTRDGLGVWLTLDGNRAITLVCAPTQHLCPPLVVANGSLKNISADRDVGSVANFSCNPGYEYAEGTGVVTCTADGTWKRPLQVVPYIAPVGFRCTIREIFCTDASELLSTGVRFAGAYQRKLGDHVSFECIEGFTQSVGDTTAVCVVNQSNDARGEWVNGIQEYYGLVKFKPLRCIPKPNYCPMVIVANGFLDSLSNTLYHGSVARFSCAPGFERKAGNYVLRCEHDRNGTGGAWMGDDGTGQVLQCGVIQNFCPYPIPLTNSVELLISNGLRLDSEVSFSCKPGYESNTARESVQKLICRPQNATVGAWVSIDGKKTSVSTLGCRGTINWCPILSMPNGSVGNITGHRRPGASATIACNIGYQLQFGSATVPNHTRVDCQSGTLAGGGKWVAANIDIAGMPTDVPFDKLWCNLTAGFCPDFIPAYTSTLSGVYMQLVYSERKYYFEFLGARELGSKAKMTCNATLEFTWSYGDQELFCGYNADRTGGAWRSIHGMLAVPFHCYFSGVPDEVKDALYRNDYCQSAEILNFSIPYTFGRTGSIAFWVQPTSWPAGGSLMQSKYDADNHWWALEYTSTPGTVVFKVTDLVGHVTFDTTRNGQKQLGDWFHFSLIWTLGVGLAGLGEVKLYVDGILSPAFDPSYGKAVPPTGVTGSQRLDHFTWIYNQPDDKLVLGSWWGPTITGIVNKIRVFSRAIPFSDSEILRKTEDPRCGFQPNVCTRASFERAYIEQISNPLDPRFQLVPLRPETRWHLRCYPGFSKTDGDEVIECKVGGVWGVPGQTRVAQLMRCCNMTLDFCPPVDISQSTGLIQAGNVAFAQATCQAPISGSAGVNYLNCPAITVPGGYPVVYSSSLLFGSQTTLSCLPGYVPENDVDMDSVVTCYRGTYVSTIHTNAQVPGEWYNAEFRPARLLRCRGIQNWCPAITVQHAVEKSASAGRRHASNVVVECIPGYSGDASFNFAKEVLFTCHLDKTWKTFSGRDISAFICVAISGTCPSNLQNERKMTWAFTAYQGQTEILTDPSAYALSPTTNQKVGYNVRVQCVGPRYNYSFGDTTLVCDLAPQLSNPMAPLMAEVINNPLRIWRSVSSSAQHQGGRPAVSLRCRDLSPQVRQAVWFSIDCLGETGQATRVPKTLGSRGTISMWVLIPDSPAYYVIWSSINETCFPKTSSTQTSTTTIQTTTHSLGPQGNISNVSNGSIADFGSILGVFAVVGSINASNVSNTTDVMAISSDVAISSNTSNASNITVKASTIASKHTTTNTTTLITTTHVSATTTKRTTTTLTTMITTTTSTTNRSTTTTSTISKTTTSSNTTSTSSTNVTSTTTTTTMNTTSTTSSTSTNKTTTTNGTTRIITTAIQAVLGHVNVSNASNETTPADGGVSHSDATKENISNMTNETIGIAAGGSASSPTKNASNTSNTTVAVETAASDGTVGVTLENETNASNVSLEQTPRKRFPDFADMNMTNASNTTHGSVTGDGGMFDGGNNTSNATMLGLPLKITTVTMSTSSTNGTSSTNTTMTAETTNTTSSTSTNTTTTTTTSTVNTSKSTSTNTSTSTSTSTTNTTSTSNSTSTTINRSTSTSTAETYTFTTTGNETIVNITVMVDNVSSNETPQEAPPTLLGRCHGPQHMILDKGFLHVQLGEDVGAYDIQVQNTSLAGAWAHLLYTWSGQTGEAYTYVNGVPATQTPGDNVPNISAFDLYLGNPPSIFPQASPPADTKKEYASVFDRPLSESEVATLHYYEKGERPWGRCSIPPPSCPELPRDGAGLRLAHVAEVTSSDPWVPPDPKRPGAVVRLECDEGHIRSGGYYLINCSSSGKWRWSAPTSPASYNQKISYQAMSNTSNDTKELAEFQIIPGQPYSDWGNFSYNETWLECCNYVDDYCPPLGAGVVFVESIGKAAACGLGEDQFLHSTSKMFRHLGASVKVGCPVGYVRVGGAELLTCSLGYHVGGINGRWVDSSGLIAQMPVCEVLDYWCPPVTGGLHSYIVSASLGRSLGSVLQFECNPGYVEDSGNATLYCVSKPDGSGGEWLDVEGNAVGSLKCKLPGSAPAGSLAASPAPPPGQVDRRYLANVTYVCKPAYIQSHGDSGFYCVLGPSPYSSDGTMGRWADKNSNGADNAELPMCVKQQNWCPAVDLAGKYSAVSNLSSSYRLGSIASLRCYVGYEPMNGSASLLCVNRADDTAGEWNRPPLVCRLARDFCPGLRVQNGYIIQTSLDYKLGDNITFKCNRGFIPFYGDSAATCSVSDNVPDRGQWKTANGTPAIALKCIASNLYCQVPNVTHGYASAISHFGQIGSALEIKCREGFRDPRGRIDRRTALCLHNATNGSAEGAFYAGMTDASKDLLRAVAMVRRTLNMLEKNEMLPSRLEVDPLGTNLSFEERWKSALRANFRSLKVDTHVKAVFQQIDVVTRTYGWPGNYGAIYFFTIDHVRMLHRLLVAETEMHHDISAEEARAMFKAYDRIKVNFQDVRTPLLDGWLRDSGDAYGDRGNGFSYGWVCSVNGFTLNDGTHNRNRNIYFTLENTLVATDERSECRGQEWRILLAPGRYRVEVTVQDTQYETLASGCALQGENLGFPDVVRPPGSRETRNLTVDVVDFLTLSADRDQRCSSVNRITIQNTADAGAGDVHADLLQCNRIENWCSPPPMAPHTYVTVISTTTTTWATTITANATTGTTVPPTAAHVLHAAHYPNVFAMQPPTTEVQYACEDGYVHQYGPQILVCGSDATGMAGEWRTVAGGKVRSLMSCVKNRAWCSEIQLLNGSFIAKLDPPSYEIGTQASLMCLAGWRVSSGDTLLKCMLGVGSGNGTGVWRAQSHKGIWDAIPSPLNCELDPAYCPALRSASADITVPPGHLGEDEQGPQETIVMNQTIQVEAEQLGKRVDVICPPNFQRVRGDHSVICDHGPHGQGTWQVVGADTTNRVDAAAAEPLVCELQTIFGVTRHHFTTVVNPHGGTGNSVYDVIPNIDQRTSAFDAAYFRAYLVAPHSGKFAFVVEVVGRFLFSFNEKVLLTGRSHDSQSKRFRSGDVTLTASEYYEVLLQYVLDPALQGAVAPMPVPRHIRLLWQSAMIPLAVVPPEALRHSLSPLHGYPRVVDLQNDPNPCASGTVVNLHNLKHGMKGVLTHGSLNRDYNANLNCVWHITTETSSRINFKATFFDVQPSANCISDSWVVRLGLTGDDLDNLCGSLTGYIASRKGTDFGIIFTTDDRFEGRGFNITYEVLIDSAPDPTVTTTLQPPR